jgi:hypothetical protein
MSDKPAAGAMHGGIFAAAELGIIARGCAGVGGRQQFSRKEICHMAIESHLAELERRHQALEQEISEALAHPSTDDLKIVELKRRKLHVKDEISRLKQDAVVH